MDKILEIIRRKPLLFVIISVVFFCIIGFLKWQLHPPIGALWFIVGGLIGVYLLDAAEVFFALHPSPIRSMLFVWAFAIVSLFVVTSSGSMLATGLVLSLYITLILWQVGQAIQVTQRWWLYAFIGLFIIESFVFLAWA